MSQQEEEKQELLVFVNTRNGECCAECKAPLDRGDFVVLDRAAGVRCLACSDLDHLVYLPAGDAALSRRARANSTLSVVVLKYSRTRKRSERQGLLVEKEGLEEAEEQCLADADARERRREREAARREKLNAEYVEQFAQEIRRLYSGCPEGRELDIAEHACLKHSGRVGRSAAAKDFDPPTVDLAVRAHIRHAETPYDRLLAEGYSRDMARDQVAAEVSRIAREWADGG